MTAMLVQHFGAQDVERLTCCHGAEVVEVLHLSASLEDRVQHCNRHELGLSRAAAIRSHRLKVQAKGRHASQVHPAGANRVAKGF